MLLLPASASMYLEALSRDMELILLSFFEKDIFELDLEGCFENHNCKIWAKKFSALCFSSLIILLNLSESMEVEAEANTEPKQKHSSDFPGSSFCFLLLLPCKYFEALSREMELIFLRLLGKDIFELELEGCFENHYC